jgi:ubiquinone/menaquinone biosynthesis C-methylase UbiE
VARKIDYSGGIYQDDLNADEDRRIAKWYNTLSASYDELYGQEQSAKHNAVLEFFEDKRFKVLIDIGCGSGTFLQHAEPFYDYAVGIDVSINMLKAAKKKRTSKNDLILATSRMLPIRRKGADGLVSISTHADHSSLMIGLEELRRISRENAVLAISLFQQEGAETPHFPFALRRATRISDRESVYCFRSERFERTVS